jgi:hypothetical protein
MTGTGENMMNTNPDDEELDLTPEDLEAIAILYDSIRAIRRKSERNNDKNLAEDFDRHLKNVMYELSNALKDDVPVSFKNANILKAKASLFDICFAKSNEFVRKNNDPTGAIYERIHEGYGTILQELMKLVFVSSQGNNREVMDLREKLDKTEKEANEIIEAAQEMQM